MSFFVRTCKGPATLAKFGTKYDSKSRNERSVFTSVRGGYWFTATTLVFTPAADTMCPRYATSLHVNQHFPGLRRSPAYPILSKTILRLVLCSSRSLPKTNISSKYTTQTFRAKPASTTSIRRLKVAGALTSPNGILVNWYSRE